ncbi:sperm-associated antigen 5 isoform X2 [Loxodonta africana]|uniref:Sperm associated antigen 5 n=1 Tax=Loxodonta africana TaxID=9785 RepID=G3T3Z8_LOXAF|nr:sperm-associated antigen 5 isoform X2 [Loxodonta africana]
MWRVKKLDLSASASPQPGKPAMRTPLRELNLEPGALTSSGKGPPVHSSLTPSLRKLTLQKSSNNSSPLDFISTKRTDSPSELFSSPSKWLEACQHESDEQLQAQLPKTNSTPKTSEEAVDLLNNYLVKTMVLVPSPVGQQQDITLEEAPLDAMEETNSICLGEPSRPGDLVKEGVAPCTEDSFSEVVATVPEKPSFQYSPCSLLKSPPNPCPVQQLYGPKESLRDSGTEAVPENLVPSESNTPLPSFTLWLSPSTDLEADFPVNHVDPGEETGEHRAIEEGEMSFPTLPEEVELEDQVLVSAMEDILSPCLIPNPVEMESQAAPGPAVEDAGMILVSDTGPWMSPLAWLEKGVNTSVMLENLRQSLSLPSVLRDAAIGTSPFSACSVGTWFTPPAVQEKSTNTSQKGLVGSKDSTSETEHLLWGRPPDLTALSRHDLEENLLSSLVILEILSRQLQEWKSQLAVPHPGAQDSSTQTNDSPSGITKKPQQLQNCQEIGRALQQARNVMQSWVLVSKDVTSLLHLSMLHLEEDKTTVSQESQRVEALVSCCCDVLKKSKAKVQSLKAEREEARQKEEMALRGKDATETVLEAFCAHASQRISQLEQDLASMREFRVLLNEAQAQLVRLHAEQEELAQQTVSLTSTLQQDWISMQLDYVTWTALLSQSRQLMEKLAAKSKEALQERDAAIEEKQKVSRELEQVSTHLEDCKGQIEQLELENICLAADLQAQVQILASKESQLKELQGQHAHCTQDLATKDDLLCQLTQSSEEQAARWEKEEMALKQTQAELQQQQAVLSKEVQDLKETLEFADQENQVAHLELGQVESQLKTTLEVLRERSLQCEDLKDTVENLKAKLASIVAESQRRDLEKTRQYSHELGVLTEQLQSLALFLQKKLKEKAEPEPLPMNIACAPAQEHPPPSNTTFLGSVLTPMADEEPEAAPVPLLGSDKSAFTRVVSMVSLQPTETPHVEKSLAEMRTMTLELESLCSLLQESKEEAVRTLHQKICDLQDRLQAQEDQHQEAQKAKEADIEKLNQALCLRYKNEKELQEVIQQQNEKILEQIDKSGELISLREEVAQLTRSLRRAETETKVLQETLAGQLDPDCQHMATDWIQEKVWLTQEVDKLRVMFLEMKDEKAKLRVKFQSHRNILEENLRRSDKELKKLDDIVQHIYETLRSIPEVVRGCKELQELLEFLS